ncbi:MAG TPA: HD domain-containing protein [Hydrogenophaga sp.]|uniref:HD domain-containing protein n=1 Tax=Hydrogenophaga sp. TaxID=1904254 RepID=UPI002B5C4844|nr:HD domain-containing protein [Hydrogenophaga sp.]HMN92658.1 HD domain-containing protein [Hydrogenophaga sp.]HMP09241.1 HD domain-containing protein [Hydrogenophaga sp.]
MKLDLNHLLELLLLRGHERYAGEPVSHLQHALQTAHLAQCAGAGASLVAAALLHDIGHLLHGRTGTPSAQGIDDRHEVIGATVLFSLFGSEVSEPVRLHVQAKRRLCLDPGYLATLSDDSQRSLALQGGPMNAHEAQLFDAHPFGPDAVTLRRWDDAAKSASAETPELAHFAALAMGQLPAPGNPAGP